MIHLGENRIVTSEELINHTIPPLSNIKRRILNFLGESFKFPKSTDKFP